jgi:hypothetical protein
MERALRACGTGYAGIGVPGSGVLLPVWDEVWLSGVRDGYEQVTHSYGQGGGIAPVAETTSTYCTCWGKLSRPNAKLTCRRQRAARASRLYTYEKPPRAWPLKAVRCSAWLGGV